MPIKDHLDFDNTDTRKLVLQILSAMQTIDYGSVEIVIHGSKVVQIECRRKIRWDTNRGD